MQEGKSITSDLFENYIPFIIANNHSSFKTLDRKLLLLYTQTMMVDGDEEDANIPSIP